MDKFEKRLKQDAAAIEVEIGDEFRRRLDASLAAAEPVHTQPVAEAATHRLWWASSLTGLAAAIAVIAILNWNGSGTAPAPEQPLARATVPDLVEPLAVPPGLDVRTAEFTSPLESELEHLKSDIERVRQTVRDDLDFTF